MVLSIAKEFGLTTEQFCRQIGYRRQALYVGIKNTPKARYAIESLHELNNQMWQQDLERASRNFERRRDAILDFEKRIKNGGEVDG